MKEGQIQQPYIDFTCNNNINVYPYHKYIDIYGQFNLYK